jgi:DNA-binding ferritin-like protein
MNLREDYGESQILMNATPSPEEVPATSGQQVDYSDMATAAFLMMCDMWSMHHNVEGPTFAEMHEMFDEYYSDEMKAEVDYFSERVKQHDMPLANWSRVADSRMYQFWEPFDPAAGKNDWRGISEELDRLGKDYVEAMRMWRENATSEEQSKVDEFLDFWSNEVEYKNKQRLAGNNADAMPIF